MGGVSGAVVAVIGSLIGLAIVAVVVGTKAQTPQVIQSAGSALSSVISAAVGPVSTGNMMGSIGQNVPGVTT